MDFAASCSLDDAELAARREAWRELTPALIESRDLPTGYTATYRGDEHTARALESLIEAERECCSDFTWRLERDAGLLKLEVTHQG